jgi:hypothetical protein
LSFVAEAQIAEPGGRRQQRSPGVLRTLSFVAQGARRAENLPAGDGNPLASGRFPSLLALEIGTARRPAQDAGGHSPAHSRVSVANPS